MKKAIYAGSFDPVTLGHMDIIERAANLFDCLVVAVLENPNKKSLFTVEERKHHLELATKHIENVEVASFQGLLVDFAKEIGANIAVRGLRNTLDFSAEYPMFLINRKLYDKIETVYLAADEEHLALSSTNVKEVAVFGGDISFMVPAEIKPFRMDSVLQLLDELEDVMDSSKAVPFSSKVTVNKEEIYDIISEIRMKLPNELKQSKWVIEERNKILIDAQREADEIVKNAEDRMVRLVDENEVTKKAYEQAAAIIDSAKKTSKDMRLGAMEYAESVLADAEGKLKELKSVVYSESIKTDDYFAQTLDVLAENIQELRMGK